MLVGGGREDYLMELSLFMAKAQKIGLEKFMVVHFNLLGIVVSLSPS